MVAATTDATKEKPAQCDVRIVGGRTTVSLRAYGVRTLERVTDLLAELNQNATTAKPIHDATADAAAALTKLMALINAEQ